MTKRQPGGGLEREDDLIDRKKEEEEDEMFKQDEKEADEAKRREDEARLEFRKKLAEKEQEITMKNRIFGTKRARSTILPNLNHGKFLLFHFLVKLLTSIRWTLVQHTEFTLGNFFNKFFLNGKISFLYKWWRDQRGRPSPTRPIPTTAPTALDRRKNMSSSPLASEKLPQAVTIPTTRSEHLNYSCLPKCLCRTDCHSGHVISEYEIATENSCSENIAPKYSAGDQNEKNAPTSISNSENF